MESTCTSDMLKTSVFYTRKHSTPIGLCARTGTPRSAIWLQYFQQIRLQLWMRNIKVSPSNNGFKFASAIYLSFGTAHLSLFTPPELPTNYSKVEIVPADVPALLGLNSPDSYQLTVDTAVNALAKKFPVKKEDRTVLYVEFWILVIPFHSGKRKAFISTYWR